MPHPGNHETLIVKTLLLDFHRGHESREGDRAGSLNVVVERKDPLTITVEEFKSLVFGEIFPLEKRVREVPFYAHDELFDELVVFFSFEPSFSVAKIERVVEKPFVVRPDVQTERKTAGRMKPAGRDVKVDFADGDTHSVGPQIAETENAFAIRHHDEVYVRKGNVPENMVDVVDVLGAEVNPAIIARDMTEHHAGLADGWRIDDREHLGKVRGKEAVKERLVAIQKRLQENILFDLVGLSAEHFIAALALRFEIRDNRAKQSG